MSEIINPYENPYMDIDERNNEPEPRRVLAMAYVPEQEWETPYNVMDGLKRGTLFPSLDKPFLGGGNKW